MNTTAHFAYFSNELKKMHTHYHDCHQILFILKGEVEICVDGVFHRAASGDLVIFSRFENHSLNILSEEYERYVLQIGPLAGGTNKIYALLANRPEGFENVQHVSDDLDSFHRLFARLTSESTEKAPLSADMLELLVQELLILIYRRIPAMPNLFEDETYSYIFEIQRRFETDCGHPFTLEELAREHNLSPSSLSHHFKKVTGTSVMDYLQNCRMAQAKKYLTETSVSIGEIVELCGFSDNSNFSRAFKKLNGLSPSAFRGKYRD